MAGIHKIGPSVMTRTKTVEKQAHEAWVRYFNSHKQFLTSPRDEFIPRKPGITQGAIGYDSLRAKTTFDEVRTEMESAVACFKNGNKKQTNLILKSLSGLDTDFDVYATFKQMLLGKEFI